MKRTRTLTRPRSIAQHHRLLLNSNSAVTATHPGARQWDPCPLCLLVTIKNAKRGSCTKAWRPRTEMTAYRLPRRREQPGDGGGLSPPAKEGPKHAFPRSRPTRMLAPRLAGADDDDGAGRMVTDLLIWIRRRAVGTAVRGPRSGPCARVDRSYLHHHDVGRIPHVARSVARATCCARARQAAACLGRWVCLAAPNGRNVRVGTARLQCAAMAPTLLSSPGACSREAP
eukprot:scaffold3713_cov372-Prasinococcus_capsulatus_cf.AAC.22